MQANAASKYTGLHSSKKFVLNVSMCSRRLCVCSLVMWEGVFRKLAEMSREEEAGVKNEYFDEKCFL